MSDVVYTPDGRGKVVEKETRHGRTWINVAGNGFNGWYLSHEVTADIGDHHVVNLDELPDPEDGARLPWDPEPRDIFHDQLNIQPTADLPPNLHDSDSIQGLRNTDPMEPFPGGKMGARTAALPWKKDQGGFSAITPDGGVVMIHQENGQWIASGDGEVVHQLSQDTYSSPQEAMDDIDQSLHIPTMKDVGDFHSSNSHPFAKERNARHTSASDQDWIYADGPQGDGAPEPTDDEKAHGAHWDEGNEGWYNGDGTKYRRKSFDLGGLKDDFEHAWYGDGYDFLHDPSGGAQTKPKRDPDDPDPDEEYHPQRHQHDDRQLSYAQRYDDFFSTDSDVDEDNEQARKVVPHTDDDPYQQVDSTSPEPGLSDYGDDYEEKNPLEYGGDPFPKKSGFFDDFFGEGGDGWDDPNPGKYDPNHNFNDGHPERKNPDQQGHRDPDDDLWNDSHFNNPSTLTHASAVEYEVAPSRDGFLVTSAAGDVLDGPYARQSDAEHVARFAAYEKFLDSDPMAREAAWADVRQKALRLRREGAVKVTYYEPKEIQGEVQGDTGYYDAAVSRKNAFGNGVTYYSCSCPWGKWAYKRQMTYIGRFCSHGLALYHEMQALDNKGNRTINDAMNPFMNPAGSTDLGNFTGWGHHSKVAMDVDDDEQTISDPMADPLTPPGAATLMQNPSHAVEPDGQMEVFSEGDPLDGQEVPHVRDDGGDADLMGEEVAHDPLGMGHPTETDDSGAPDADIQQAQIEHDMHALRDSNTGAPADSDIAVAARSFLARTAAKQYSLAEQEELMGEKGSAHQLHSLNLENSLYSEGPSVIFLD